MGGWGSLINGSVSGTSAVLISDWMFDLSTDIKWRNKDVPSHTGTGGFSSSYGCEAACWRELLRSCDFVVFTVLRRVVQNLVRMKGQTNPPVDRCGCFLTQFL